MYDTIRMSAELVDIKNLDLNDLASKLSNLYVTNYKMTGKLDNLFIKVTDYYLSISNSISKYYYGNNVKNLTREDFKRAINKLNDALGFKVDDFKVTQLDIAANVFVDLPPSNYISHFGEYSRLNRVPASEHSIRYTAVEHGTKVYDKVKETGKSKIPFEYFGKEIIRIEHSFNRNLAKQLKHNQKKVFVSDLYDEDFFSRIKDIWVERYHKIQKRNIPSLTNWDDISTTKTATEMIVGVLINSCENHDEIFKCLFNELKSRNPLKYAKYYTKVKQDVKRLQNSPIVTGESPLIKELDEKVEDFRLYFN